MIRFCRMKQLCDFYVKRHEKVMVGKKLRNRWRFFIR